MIAAVLLLVATQRATPAPAPHVPGKVQVSASIYAVGDLGVRDGQVVPLGVASPIGHMGAELSQTLADVFVEPRDAPRRLDEWFGQVIPLGAGSTCVSFTEDKGGALLSVSSDRLPHLHLSGMVYRGTRLPTIDLAMLPTGGHALVAFGSHGTNYVMGIDVQPQSE